MSPVEVVTWGELDALARVARDSPRQRSHRLLHRSHADPVQRLFIAMQPDSYIRPHCHDDVRETLVGVRGRFEHLVFDDHGYVTDRFFFGVTNAGAASVEIPPTTWHMVIAHTPDALLFEVKAGPFDPSCAKSLAAWAPSEDDPASAAWLARVAGRSGPDVRSPRAGHGGERPAPR